MAAFLPINEDARLDALHQFNILDTLPSSAFDDITELAAQICQTPIALISFVDRDRQWFKSRIGMEATQTPRDVSFCAHTILEPDEMLVVKDAGDDVRFADSPLVTSDLGIRFYAGAPIVTSDGYALGVLCVMDRQPRKLNADQLTALRTLSRLVINQLDLHRRQQEQLDQVLNLAQDGIFMADPVDLRFIYVNQGAQQQTGYSRAELLGMTVLAIDPGTTEESLRARLAPLLNGEVDALTSTSQHRRKDGTDIPVEMILQRSADFAGTVRLVAFVRDLSERKQAERQRQMLIESMPDGVLVVDEQGKIVVANARTEKLFGYQSQELLGQSINMLLPEQVRQTHHQHRDQYMAAPRTRSMGAGLDLFAQRKDGSEFPVDISLSSMETEHGRSAIAVIRDITERKQQEEALRKSEESYRRILSRIDEIVYELSGAVDKPFEMQVDFVSDRVHGALGYHPAELKADSFLWISLIHPDDRPALREQTSRIMASGQSGLREYRIQDIHGVYHWMEDRMTIDTDAAGQVARLFGVARDVTERKVAEERIRQAEASASSVLASLSAHIAVVNRQGIVIAVNEAWQRFARANRGDQATVKAVGMCYLEIMNKVTVAGEGTIQAATEGLLAVLNGVQNRFTMEYAHPSPTEQRWYEMRVVPLNDINGGAVISHQSISARKLAQESLRLSEARFRALIENSSDGISVIDEHGTIMYSSPAITRMLGYAADDMVGRNRIEMIHPDDLVFNMKRLQELLQHPDEPVTIQSRFRHQNGTWRWLEATGTNSLDDPAVQGIVWNARDITKRKQAESERAQLLNVLETSLNEIYIIDAESLRFQYVNQGARHNLGYSEAAMSAMTPVDVKPEFTPASFRTLIAPVLSGEEEKLLFHTVHRRADGSLYPVEIHMQLSEYEGKRSLSAIALDITERKQAELALRASEERYRAIIDNSTVGIYQSTPEGRFISVNPAMAHIYGYDSVAEMLGEITDVAKQIYVDPTKRQEFIRLLAESGRVSGFIDPNYRKDGSIIWTSTSARVVKDPEGKALYYEGFLADITERKRTEARIETQLRRLAALHAIDTAITNNTDLDPMLEAVLTQTIDHLDADAAAVLRFNPDTQMFTFAVGRGFRTRFIHAAELSVEDSFAGQAAKEQRLVQISQPVQNQTNPRFSAFCAAEGFAEYHGMPLMVKGDLVGVLEVFHRQPFTADPELQAFMQTLAGQAAIAVDNAALFAKTQTLLEQSQAQAQLTQQIIDTTPEGMVVLDRERRLVLVNPTALVYLPALAELSSGDVVTDLGDQPLAIFLRPNGDTHLRDELTLGHPPRILEIAVEPLTVGPHAGGWMLVMWDVTAERDRQRYQHAQERLATVGQLAAGVAHDFNNIMGAIVLYAQMLGRSANLSEKERGQLATIRDQAHHATNLIRQILDFSRRSVMEKAAVDLAPLVKELTKLLERTLPENVRPSLVYDRAEYIVFGDATRLQQVLMNLAINARDAMPHGGALRFALSILTIAPDQTPPLPDMTAGEWVSLGVSDTGTGIEPTHIDRLFEPFFTTKEPGKGTGLGLAQVYGIVKQHGGFIAVHSQMGVGTTFTVYLPVLTSAPVPMRKIKTESVTAGGSETILLVEDNPALRQSVADTLVELGYQVLSAANGVGALEIFANQDAAIDLVLTDLVMPGLGGGELAKMLRHQRPDIKILIMTANPVDEIKSRMQDLEGIEWLQKPFEAEDLADHLRAVLDGSDG